ncbi:MAG: alcohol dehydrogenase catalytic domain-containing protein [Syntrophaceae bacterium]|nr:alcohol dehydrogenase catalytic domain-containing protein [Syntrophaceae bacterium]
MKALFFDGALRFRTDAPEPPRAKGWARIRVHTAGICGTDLQILAGYHDYRGIPGHEFVGVVEDGDDPSLIGRRVVGEINIGCGRCACCKAGMERHCLERRVLGIIGHPGCMAEFCSLPLVNLHPVPEEIGDERAVFVEPLSAACEILEQVPLRRDERAVVLGNGRIGILCAWILSTVLEDVTLVGHHPAKLEAARWHHLKTCEKAGEAERSADLVVEATGSAHGLAEALALCRPRGTVVLKTTLAASFRIDLAPVVVKEISVVGSRCGRFADGLEILRAHPDMPLERLITGRYPLERGVEAFEQAKRKDSLKVLLELL